jgi:hypothetical protein
VIPDQGRPSLTQPFRYINSASTNNPSYEFYPPKSINGHNGTQIASKFLVDTLNGNLFPHIYVLPDTTLLVVANQGAMTLNWRTDTERRLPNIPNGVRVTSVLIHLGLSLASCSRLTPQVPLPSRRHPPSLELPRQLHSCFLDLRRKQRV